MCSDRKGQANVCHSDIGIDLPLNGPLLKYKINFRVSMYKLAPPPLQGPLRQTSAHFWQMVWEQNTYGIVMLNKIIEKGMVRETCVCVCVCVCACACVCMCVCACVCACMCMHVCMHVSVCMCVCMCVFCPHTWTITSMAVWQ